MPARHLVSLLFLSAVSVGAVGCGGEDSPITPSLICTYTIAPATSSFASEGGSGSIAVTAPASCTWTATAGASWITIGSGGSGSGSGSVAYAVTANAATDARSATLTIAGQTHTVTQQGKPATVCSYDISPANADVDVGETRGTFAVTAPADCTWTASSNAAWLIVTAGSSGISNGRVSYQVAANADIAGRLASITVADKTFTVRQNGSTAQCQYWVSPVDFNPCMPASSITATVTAPQGCTWTATPNVSWLTLPSGSSGNGSGTITINFTENYDAPRDGIVLVRWPTPTAGQNVRIAQAGCLYAVSQSSFSVAATGGPGTFNVIQQATPNTCGGATQDRCIWSAVADVPWVTIAGGMPRAGDDRVAFTVAANATGAPRVGRITVRDKVVAINQAQ